MRWTRSVTALALASLISPLALAGNQLSARAAYQDFTPGWDQTEYAWDVTNPTTVATSIDRVADGGTRQASAEARLNTQTGSVKLYSAAHATAASGDRTYAEAGVALWDDLTVSSAGASSSTLSFALGYDTLLDLSPVGAIPSPQGAYPAKHNMLSFNLNVSWQEANPNYTGEPPEGSGEEWSEPEFITVRKGLTGRLWVFWDADGGTQYHSFLGETGTDTPPLLDLTVDNALPDARWQGTALFNVNVPTNTALQFEWGTESRSFCFQTQACRAEADGLHSFNLSLSASTGTVLSGSGYDFLGQPAPPVPEPSTWALLLGGLGIAWTAAAHRRRT